MATMEERLAAVERQLAAMSVEKETLKRRLWLWRSTAGLLLLLGLLFGPPQLGRAQGTTEERLAALETKLARVSVANGGADIIISGANLNIVNGAGSTQTANGLGNLILGYNEARGGGLDQRTGSHNLVLGQQNNYTSFGGIVGGFQNQLSGPFSHVLTGNGNATAAGAFYALVGTGQLNNAAHNYAAVYAGNNNTATGLFSAVTGGSFNATTGEVSAVSGGFMNTAGSFNSVVSGGQFNTATGIASVVSAGESNRAIGVNSSVSGGVSNDATGTRSSVSGGHDNTAGGESSSISGGISEIIGTAMANQYDWRAGNAVFSDE
jgi:hypothetical protein